MDKSKTFGSDRLTRIQEYKRAYKAPVSDIYYNAAKMALCYGDKARASVFGEKAHRLRVTCTGEDGEDIQDIEGLISDPASHKNFGLLKECNSSKDDVPKDLDKEDFEKWLWRLE